MNHIHLLLIKAIVICIIVTISEIALIRALYPAVSISALCSTSNAFVLSGCAFL